MNRIPHHRRRPRASAGRRTALWVACFCLQVAILAASIPARALAQAGRPDARVAVPILLKVITYDRKFGSRGSGDFVVLVASEPAQASSREEVLQVLRSLKVTTIQNRPLRFVGIEFRDAAGLNEKAREQKAGAILAVPGISNGAVQAIKSVAEGRQVYSLALDHEMVEKSLALGVTAKNGRPQILINMPASKEIGAEFETSVLKLAVLIQ